VRIRAPRFAPAFVIDPVGIIRAISWYPMNVGRSVEELLRLVTALQTSDRSEVFTPEGWRRAIPARSAALVAAAARRDCPPRGRPTGITAWSPSVAEARRKTQATGMHGRADEVSELLKLLGNKQRLLIACLLCEGEYAVSEIEEKLGIRQPTRPSNLARCARPA